MRFALSVLMIPVIFSMGATQIEAATADGGSGPYADIVRNFSQGNKKDGSGVDAGNSDSDDALGVIDGQAVSLGFGGSIELTFENDNAIVDEIEITEVSNSGSAALESVDVYMSANGASWFFAGSENRSGTVDLPNELDCALHVRLIDTSDASQHADDDDGYDVDAVESVNPGTCNAVQIVINNVPTPTPTIAAPTSTPTPTATTTNDSGSGSSSNPTSSSNSTANTNTMSLGKNGPSCSALTFGVTAELKANGVAASDKLVVFRYGAIQKTATTNGEGRAGVSFDYFGSGEVVTESADFPTQRLNVDTLVCDGQVLGTTSDDTAVGGRVLGATTERLAATGTHGYVQLFLIAGAVTSAAALVVMRMLRV